MLRVVAIMLLVLLANVNMPSTYLQLITHFEAFEEHYQDHLNEGEDLDFISFLLLHSAENEHTSTDDNGHDELPINHHPTPSPSFHINLFHLQAINPSLQLTETIIDLVFDLKEEAHSNYLNTIWQPPKHS